MVVSVGLHVALLLLGWWLIDQNVKPTISPRVLVFSLEQSPLDSPQNIDSETIEQTVSDVAVGTAQPEVESPAPTQPAAKSQPAPPEKPQIEAVEAVAVAPSPATTPEIAEIKVVVGVPTPAPSESQHLPASAEVDRAPSIAQLTVAESSFQIAVAKEIDLAPTTTSEPATTPISSEQQQMLTKQVKRWSEALDFSQISEPVVWEHKGQSYSASFKHLPAGGAMDLDQLMIEVVTEQDGQQLTTKMRMKKLAFSNYAQFVHRWDPEVQIHDDELNGRFHSNSEISVAYDRRTQPTFHGKVTVASRRVNLNRNRSYRTRDEIFRGGLETGVTKVLMPRRFLPFPEDTDIDHAVISFEEDTKIQFEADGKVQWTDLESGQTNHVQLADQATYFLADPGAILFVSGTIKGKALVYSPKRIVIEDDLVYAAGKSDRGTDFIGLVSDRNIEIAAPKVTGPGDLTVHGSIYAKRRFKVVRYRARNQGTLHLFGSLSAGSLTATEPRFATKISFDPRLENLRPPGFPVTNRYEVASQDSDWQTETDQQLD